MSDPKYALDGGFTNSPKPMSEGPVVKGGVNPPTSFTRPPPPAPMKAAPDRAPPTPPKS